MRHPVFCRAFSGLLGVCCFFGMLRVLGFFRGVRCFSRFPGFPAAFCRGPHAAVGETLLGRKSFVNELFANRRYRKICYYESGGIVFLSYFIVFLVGAWSACRGRLLKKWVMTCVRSYFLLYRVCRVVIYCYLYTINIEITQKDTV